MNKDEIRREFEDTGVIRLKQAFTATEAGAMRDAVWGYAAKKNDLRIDDRRTWPHGFVGVGWKGLRRSAVFDPFINNPALTGTLEVIFGEGGWTPPRAGSQLLVTFPESGPWTLPNNWHMDCGFERATWPTFAVKLFGFFDTVDPEGGGTMILPGSHRVVERYRDTIPPGTGAGKVNWEPFMRHHPWLAELMRGAQRADHGRPLVGQRTEIDGVPIEVEEMTGEPGDIVLTHLHVFHSAAPNTTGRPRQMMGKEIRAATASRGE